MTHDPFKLTGPTCLSFSGGRTSAYMLWRVLQANTFHDIKHLLAVCFAKTGKEDEATLRFVDRCSREWGVKVHWIEYSNEGYIVVDFATASRSGEPFEALIRKRQFLPNPVTRFCTQELKIRPIAQHLAVLGFEGTKSELENLSMMGIRADEPRRVAKVADKGRIPLYLAGLTVQDVALFWAAHPFDLELPSYGGRTLHGNCDLCFLKPAGQIASLIAEQPARAVWWARMEKLASTEFAEKVKGDGWRFRMDRPGYQRMKDFANQQRDMFDPNEEALACFCGDWPDEREKGRHLDAALHRGVHGGHHDLHHRAAWRLPAAADGLLEGEGDAADRRRVVGVDHQAARGSLARDAREASGQVRTQRGWEVDGAEAIFEGDREGLEGQRSA